MSPHLRWLFGALLLTSLGACSEDAAGVTGAKAGTVATGADAKAGKSEPTITPTTHQGSDGYVEFEAEWQAAEARLEVRVAIGQFTDLFGIAGHLVYDPEALQLLDMQPNGVPTGASESIFVPRTVVKESPTGRILLGGARVPSTIGMQYQPQGAKVGREIWLVAHFRLLKAGSTVLKFDPATVVARGPDGTDRATEWGQLTVDANQVPEVKP